MFFAPTFLIDPVLTSLPSLLVRLLDQAEGESLERLQLLAIKIEIGEESSASSAWQKLKSERLKEGKDNFLILSGETNQGQPLKISLRYFVRGLKKYFILANEERAENFKPWRSFGAAWIAQRLKELGQDNPIFYDQKLAELNGRQEILVPNHLLFGEMVKEAFKGAGSFSTIHTIEAEFHKSIKIDEELLVEETLHENGLELRLKSESLAMVLYLRG